MLVLMLMSMLMSHASVDLFVLSFVLPCAYAYVASENQVLISYSFHALATYCKHTNKVKQKSKQKNSLKRTT